MCGTTDERPALRLAWRALLANQAHDSICGCSVDAVHAQMEGRFDTANGLADATAARLIERIAGLGPERRTPWTEEFDVAVFNPSPHPRTDVVHIAIDGFPPIAQAGDGGELHPRCSRGSCAELSRSTVRPYACAGRPIPVGSRSSRSSRQSSSKS